jgi:hypothetical protein
LWDGSVWKVAGKIILMLSTALLWVGCMAPRVQVRAVYLRPANGSHLSEDELKAYPQVASVNAFEALKGIAWHKAAIWIDKDALDLVDHAWIQRAPQEYYPLVVVGYNNALYSFRESGLACCIRGPYIDWKTRRLEPGFSVWMRAEDKSTLQDHVNNFLQLYFPGPKAGRRDISADGWLKGYDQLPSVKDILRVTDQLLEGKPPP